MSTNTTQYTTLKGETRLALTTPEAAFHLNLKPQTLRAWACKETGPIRPQRVGGRLAWRVMDILRVLGVRA